MQERSHVLLQTSKLYPTHSPLRAHGLSGTGSEFGAKEILEVKTHQANAAAAAAAAFTPQMGSEASRRAGKEAGLSALLMNCSQESGARASVKHPWQGWVMPEPQPCCCGEEAGELCQRTLQKQTVCQSWAVKATWTLPFLLLLETSEPVPWFTFSADPFSAPFSFFLSHPI